ncbi:uncharacterized protein LOC115310657 [Ixodes scapularis]|uniref:uncharacterized protein LOC115310657 n=1 Tax=Ixodes scapularis TaxID=6945 RepID=UPI001A9F8E9F|nr:uncharacterized protein LOC115310657 [Ixodes scapularis]
MTTTALLFALCLLGLAAAQGGFDYDSPEENPDDNPVIDISSEEITTSFPETTPAGVGSQILRQHKALINKIQTMIQNGKDSERNLTSLRRVVARKMRRETNQNKRKQLQSRMKELTRLITNLRDRNTKAQRELNKFLSKVNSGQITSTREAYKILKSIYQKQVVPVNNLAHKAKILTWKITKFIKKIVKNIGGIVSNIFGAIGAATDNP